MAKLTISDAARVCRVARSTLQRAISAGRLSLDADHHVDTAELLRAGYTLHDALHGADRRTRQEALQDAAPQGRSVPPDAAGPPQGDAALVQQALAALERENTLLRATLDAALAREHTAQEREGLLLRMLHEAQQRHDRLLEGPRPPVIPVAVPPDRLPPAPRARPAGARGVMRQRIVALLNEHPEGLRSVEIQRLLGVDRPLANTLLGMRRDGLLQRLAYGRYGAAGRQAGGADGA